MTERSCHVLVAMSTKPTSPASTSIHCESATNILSHAVHYKDEKSSKLKVTAKSDFQIHVVYTLNYKINVSSPTSETKLVACHFRKNSRIAELYPRHHIEKEPESAVKLNEDPG